MVIVTLMRAYRGLNVRRVRKEKTMIRFLVTLFLGWAGVHKFLDKKTGIGLLYLLTGGLFSIGWIFDTIKAFVEYCNTQKVTSNADNGNIIEVVGEHYKKNNIASLVSGNHLYNLPDGTFIEKVQEHESVYRYKYRETTAVLVPEPTNKHDPNAIMVLIDNIHVGYVPAHRCLELKKKLNQIETVTAHISSGDYKYHNGHDVYNKEADFKVELFLIMQ